MVHVSSCVPHVYDVFSPVGFSFTEKANNWQPLIGPRVHVSNFDWSVDLYMDTIDQSDFANWHVPIGHPKYVAVSYWPS